MMKEQDFLVGMLTFTACKQCGMKIIKEELIINKKNTDLLSKI